MNRTQTDDSTTKKSAPPKTAASQKSSRRSVVKAALFGSFLQLPSPAFQSHADAELISLCEEFRSLEQINREMWHYDDPEFWTKIQERQQMLVSSITTLSPRSSAGLRAMARALIGWRPDLPTHEIDDLCGADAELLGHLLRSLIEASVN